MLWKCFRLFLGLFSFRSFRSLYRFAGYSFFFFWFFRFIVCVCSSPLSFSLRMGPFLLLLPLIRCGVLVIQSETTSFHFIFFFIVCLLTWIDVRTEQNPYHVTILLHSCFTSVQIQFQSVCEFLFDFFVRFLLFYFVRFYLSCLAKQGASKSLYLDMTAVGVQGITHQLELEVFHFSDSLSIDSFFACLQLKWEYEFAWLCVTLFSFYFIVALITCSLSQFLMISAVFFLLLFFHVWIVDLFVFG